MGGHLIKGVTAQDHILGPWDAPVTLIEYGDYQCVYCGKAYGILKRVIARMDGSLRFVFRNFPVAQVHPMAKSAARAAEAAALQGKFWQMHDALYENQSHLNEDSIRAIASGLGLEVSRFNEDWMERKSIAQRVQQDFISGVRSGVSSTPGFFINEELYTESWEEGDLVRALSARLRSPEAA